MTTQEKIAELTKQEAAAYAPIEALDAEKKKLMDAWHPIYAELNRLKLRAQVEAEMKNN